MQTAIQIKYHALIAQGINPGAQLLPGSIGNIDTEDVCADGVGRFRMFQYGAIYWKPNLPACYIHGVVYAKWVELGREIGMIPVGSTRGDVMLGYPITDEYPFIHHEGDSILAQRFENGWMSYRSTGAPYIQVHTAITELFDGAHTDHIPRVLIEKIISNVIRTFIASEIQPRFQNMAFITLEDEFVRINHIDDYSYADGVLTNRQIPLHMTLKLSSPGRGSVFVDPMVRVEFLLNEFYRPVMRLKQIHFGPFRDADLAFGHITAELDIGVRPSLDAAETTYQDRDLELIIRNDQPFPTIDLIPVYTPTIVECMILKNNYRGDLLFLDASMA